MLIRTIPYKDWEPISEEAHLIVFGTKISATDQRVDYVMVAEDECRIPLGYITIRENSKDVAYWQFGGAFPPAKNSILSFRVYEAFVKEASKKYKVIYTLIENTNTVMLKFAMKVGFLITGIRYVNGSIMCEHALIFKEK